MDTHTLERKPGKTNRNHAFYGQSHKSNKTLDLLLVRMSVDGLFARLDDDLSTLCFI